MAIDRKAMQEQLKKRQEDMFAAKGETLSNFESYYSTPEGVSQFKIQPTDKGVDVVFDIVPFEVGSNYPTNNKYGLNQGDLAYVLDVWVHYSVGPSNKTIVCPLNYGEPCPLCEKKLELRTKDDYYSMSDIEKQAWNKEHNEIVSKRRCIYNVIIRGDVKEEEKGIQIFESSYFYSEEKYQEKRKAMEKRGGGTVLFASPDKGIGQTIEINYALNGKNWKVGAADFIARAYDISDEEIESAAKLDELLTPVKAYDEILKMMGMPKSQSSNTEEEKPVVNRRELKPPVQEVKQESSMGDDVPLYTDNCVNTETGEMNCPIEAEFSTDYDNYEECDKCPIKMECKIASESPAEPEPEPEPTPVRRKRTLKS